MGQFELLPNTGRKRKKEHLQDIVFIPRCCKNISPLGLFHIKWKVTHCTQDNTGWDVRDAVGTAHRQVEFSNILLYLHSQQHLVTSDLACFPCSWRWHFKLPEREVTPISDFTYKHGNRVLCALTAQSSVSFFYSLKD